MRGARSAAHSETVSSSIRPRCFIPIVAPPARERQGDSDARWVPGSKLGESGPAAAGLDALQLLAELQDGFGVGELARSAAEHFFHGLQVHGPGGLALLAVFPRAVAEQGARQVVDAPAAADLVTLEDEQAGVRHHQAGEI